MAIHKHGASPMNQPGVHDIGMVGSVNDRE
jgi:hypothetical protein